MAEIKKALLWLHNPKAILPWLLPILPNAFVVLVLGSTDGRPATPNMLTPFVTVRLGSMPPANGSRRWLTDQEISKGVITAFESGCSQIVGKIF
jgi:hypothetical protein